MQAILMNPRQRAEVRKWMLYESAQESARLARRIAYELGTHGKLYSFVTHARLLERVEACFARHAALTLIQADSAAVQSDQ